MRQISVLTVSIVASLSAHAQERCDYLSNQVEHANKALASNMASGVGDNSAPRATNRALEDLGQQIKQQTAIQLAISEGCDTSNMRPNDYGPFIAPALQCATESLKGNFEAEVCDLTTWTRGEEE